MTRKGKIGKVWDRWQLFYALLMIAVIAALLYFITVPIEISQATKAVYDYINDDGKLAPSSPVLIDIGYEDDARAELEPQVIAIMKHLFDKKCKLVFLSTATYGPLAFRFLQSSASDLFEGKQYGEDYVFLGYIASDELTLASLAKNITGTVVTDNYGALTLELPLMVEANNASTYGLIVIASSRVDTFSWYFRQWSEPYHTPLLFGALSAVASSIESYVEAGHVVGVLSGQRAAGEYELLVGRKGSGMASLDAQRSLHELLLLFIILGNIFAYAKLSKKVRKRLKFHPKASNFRKIFFFKMHDFIII